jgi:acylphosphatase
MPDEQVLTPGGYRPKSVVNLIEAGHSLQMDAGRIKKVSPTGQVIADLGVIEARAGQQPLMPANVFVPKTLVKPALGSGWITYASWTNTTGHPLTSFRTTWVVPPAPSTQSGQTIFLFNGIQNSTMIYQPVLQWGPSAAGGGNSWTVASWYVDGQGGPAFHTNLVNVAIGQTLIGVMTLTGSSGSQFSYSCDFQGIAGTSLPVTNIQQLTWCIETLECYGMQKCSDYPDCEFTAMRNIAISCGTVTPSLAWSPQNPVTDCGQHCSVVSNSATNGEVDLYYEKFAVALTRVAAAALNSDGRLEVFGVGTNNALWHIWQTAPHAGPWSAWASLSGVLTGEPSSIDNSDGRLEVFARGTDNALWHIWQTAPHTGPWSSWASLGGIITSDPAVACNSDGRLEAFARGTDNALWHIWQTAPHTGPWSGWASLGGIITSDPAVVVNSDGRLEVFARGTDNALWHIWQTAPHAGPWSAWASLGGIITSDPATFVNSDGRIEVFARGTDNALWHIWQTAPHTGPWSAWASLGGIITSDPVVIDNSDGRLEVFARGTDNALWHIWQTVPHAGPWSAWGSLGGGITSDPVVIDNSDGRLEVFARGTDEALWHIWQTTPHAGPWSAWQSLGGILIDDPSV